MVSVFSSADQVVTHLLFFFSISCILGTMGLIGKKEKKVNITYLWIWEQYALTEEMYDIALIRF